MTVQPLQCSTIVYRTVTRARDIVAGQPLTNVFIRRPPPKDADGLSVDYNVVVPDGCAPGLTGKRAVLSLHVGHVRDTGLDVIPDSPTHANITGLPRPEDDQLRAERLAAQLVVLSRLAWSKS